MQNEYQASGEIFLNQAVSKSRASVYSLDLRNRLSNFEFCW